MFEQKASSAHPAASSNFTNEADLDVSMESIHLDSDASEIVSIYFCSIIILADIWISNMNIKSLDQDSDSTHSMSKFSMTHGNIHTLIQTKMVLKF